MPRRALAVIHDPERRLGPAEADRRLSAALRDESPVSLYRDGCVAAASTGPPPAPRTTGLVVADSDVDAGLEHLLGPDTPLERLGDLRGGFAVLAWDGSTGLLARDHLGARPLFWATEGSVLFAASEVALLLRLLSRRPAPDLDRLALWLARMHSLDGGTLFRGVRAVPPAHAIVLGANGARLERYWRPVPRTRLDTTGADGAADVLRDGIRAAVRGHAGPPDRTGVLLSGGLDSSTVLACAAANARAASARLPTAFSAVFPEHPELDESTVGALAADHVRAQLVRVAVRRAPVLSAAQAYLERWELPLGFPNLAFFKPVLDEARRHGMRVLLDGEGGDELFGCEPMLLADRVLEGDLAGAWRLAHRLPGAPGRIDRRAAAAIGRHYLVPGVLPPRVVAALRRVRRPGGRGPHWLRPDVRRAISRADGEGGAWRQAGTPRWLAHLAWTVTDGRAAGGVHDELRRAAAMSDVSDAHPFLDVDLIELVLGLPPDESFGRRLDRPLLRRAMEPLLPDPVRLRGNKVFFNRLLDDALGGPERGVFETVLTDGRAELSVVTDRQSVRDLWRAGPDAHPGGRMIWALDVWRAFTAEMWLRREAGRVAA